MPIQPDPTFIATPPSESMLLTLARAAMATGTGDGVPTFPHLDLSDPAQRRFGDYELLEEIGRGGMGVVYRAHQHSLDREVAIKFIASGLADADSVARFLSEARAAARLMHPRIVPVHEVGSVDGLHYFSMPLVRGRSLSARLHDDGPMPAEDAVSLLLALCDAISYAHGLGLLHLDLKPANILFDERGEPLVADFGLARHVDENGGVDAQEVSGTPAYMAPEQILIRQYRLTRATDLYALGAILFRCLTGKSPHGGGESDEIIRRAVAGRIVPPRQLMPRLAPDLEAVCLKCLELEPAERYASVAALADDLRRVRDGLAVSVRRAGVIERARRWCRREPRLAVATAAAVLALCAGIIGTGWMWREAAAQRDVAIAERNAAEAARQEAESARRIADDASTLGALVFADGLEGTGDDVHRATNARARNLIEQLRSRHAGDESRQAEVLTAFVNALDGVDAERSDQFAERFLNQLAALLGAEYRRQVVEALLAGEDPERYELASRLVAHDADSIADPVLLELVERALDIKPEDPRLLHQLVQICDLRSREPCPWPDAVRRLTELDSGNAYAWARLFLASEGEEARAALREAARRTRFVDLDAAYVSTAFAAYDRAALPVPPLLAAMARAHAPNDPPEALLAKLHVDATGIPSWGEFYRRCQRQRAYFLDVSAYDDCLAVAKMMMRARGALAFANAMGTHVVRHLAPDGPLRAEADETWRRLVYISSTYSRLRREDRMQGRRDTRRFSELFANVGEYAALANIYGFPVEPPAGWQPPDPEWLLRPEDRPARD